MLIIYLYIQHFTLQNSKGDAQLHIKEQDKLKIRKEKDPRTGKTVRTHCSPQGTDPHAPYFHPSLRDIAPYGVPQCAILLCPTWREQAVYKTAPKSFALREISTCNLEHLIHEVR